MSSVTGALPCPALSPALVIQFRVPAVLGPPDQPQAVLMSELKQCFQVPSISLCQLDDLPNIHRTLMINLTDDDQLPGALLRLFEKIHGLPTCRPGPLRQLPDSPGRLPRLIPASGNLSWTCSCFIDGFRVFLLVRDSFVRWSILIGRTVFVSV